MGLMAIVPTLGLYIEDRYGLVGEDLQSWTARIFAAAPLTAACVGPFWGGLGDRWGRKPMVIRAGLAICVTTAIMPLAPSPLALLLLRMLQGAFAGFVAPAMALGLASVGSRRQGLVIGRLQVAMALGLLVGPALGAEVAHRFDRAAVFYFTSIVSLVAVLPVALWAREHNEDEAQDRQKRSLVSHLRADLGALLGSGVFVGLLGCVFLMRFGQHMVEPFVALWVPELGALPLLKGWVGDSERAMALTIAMAFGVLAGAQLLFTAQWGRLADRIGPLRCLAIVGLGLSLVFMLTSQVVTIGGFMILRGLAAIFMAGSMTLAYAAVARRVTSGRQSLAFSLVQSGMQFGLALGPVLGDVMAGGHGMSRIYGIGGLCLAVAGVGMIVIRVVGPPAVDAEAG